MSVENIRALYRKGEKIAALRALREEGASLAEAQASLTLLATPDDHASFRAAVDARTAVPWVETAPGIFEPANQATPVCTHCNDTHRMELRDRIVACTHCPTPCETCRAGLLAYCKSAPCSCVCHEAPRRVTADTITDEQIRELLTLVTLHETAGHTWQAAACYCALGIDETDDSSAMRTAKRYRARIRCAEIFNARRGV